MKERETNKCKGRRGEEKNNNINIIFYVFFLIASLFNINYYFSSNLM